MTNKTKWIGIFAAFAVVIAIVLFLTADWPSGTTAVTGAPDSAEAEQGEEHAEGSIEMSAAERQARGVVTAPAKRRPMAGEITVPGEVMPDLYRSAQVTPRISAQVVARQAKLGDQVEAGQPLVTLSSVEMADAQGALIVATREWRRVQNLGRDVVSEQRYVEAQVTTDTARAKVQAYGMTPKQAEALAKESNASKADGTFDLLAPQAGTIIQDDFVLGEVVEPGRVLFQISDESRMWVEAQLTPDQASGIESGAPVRVLAGDGHEVRGRVIQAHHKIDETTRTLPVRIEVDNRNDDLHPGQFVNVIIEVGASKPVLAVPQSAVVLMDGSSTVFKVEGDELYPTSIEIGERRGDWVEITSGLTQGDEIAVSEVFLLKSLIQKSQMGEGHGH